MLKLPSSIAVGDCPDPDLCSLSLTYTLGKSLCSRQKCMNNSTLVDSVRAPGTYETSLIASEQQNLHVQKFCLRAADRTGIYENSDLILILFKFWIFGLWAPASVATWCWQVNPQYTGFFGL